MGWGLGFGIFLWFFGPLTIFPVIGHEPLDWSADQGTALFGSLVGYILYGFIYGTQKIQSHPFRLPVKRVGLNKQPHPDSIQEGVDCSQNESIENVANQRTK